MPRFPKQPSFFIVVWECPASGALGISRSTFPALQFPVMGFSYPSYQFTLHPFYTGAEGRRNNHLFSLNFGVHIALTGD